MRGHPIATLTRINDRHFYHFSVTNQSTRITNSLLSSDMELTKAAIEIDDGWYVGKWSGNQIEFYHNGHQIFVNTDLGVRGTAQVIFRSEGGKLVPDSITDLQNKDRKNSMNCYLGDGVWAGKLPDEASSR